MTLSFSHRKRDRHLLPPSGGKFFSIVSLMYYPAPLSRRVWDRKALRFSVEITKPESQLIYSEAFTSMSIS